MRFFYISAQAPAFLELSAEMRMKIGSFRFGPGFSLDAEICIPIVIIDPFWNELAVEQKSKLLQERILSLDETVEREMKSEEIKDCFLISSHSEAYLQLPFKLQKALFLTSFGFMVSEEKELELRVYPDTVYWKQCTEDQKMDLYASRIILSSVASKAQVSKSGKRVITTRTKDITDEDLFGAEKKEFENQTPEIQTPEIQTPEFQKPEIQRDEVAKKLAQALGTGKVLNYRDFVTNL